MRNEQAWRLSARVWVVALVLLLAAGCEGPSSPGPRTPVVDSAPHGPRQKADTRPGEPPAAPSPEGGVGQSRAADQPPDAPASDDEQAKEDEQRIPDYVTVLERFQRGDPVTVHAQTTAPVRLVIETENVRRLRIDRRLLKLDRNGSIVLRLDGQGIEWTPRWQTVEFERSPSGAWTPVKKIEP
ncbi:MAG: hypothetical protein KKB50_07875 [Planctomycetes bacterium]|nr:hypothetical protein [Planctomycetota bacterium]